MHQEVLWGWLEIENDRDVWNLKNEDKVEIVYEPRRDNIVKKAVVEDTKPKSSWDKFTGGNKLGRHKRYITAFGHWQPFSALLILMKRDISEPNLFKRNFGASER